MIDASVVLYLISAGRLADLEPYHPVGPPLLWSEVTSVLRRAAWRGVITDVTASASLDTFLSSAVESLVPGDLYPAATRIAASLGWAKTYDAEYLALAQILEASLLTRDARLKRGAAHLVSIIGPHDL